MFFTAVPFHSLYTHDIGFVKHFIFLSVCPVELPKCFLLLLKNPIYMLINLDSVFKFSIVTGFLTFIPKYLETQFEIPTGEASLYAGKLSLLIMG